MHKFFLTDILGWFQTPAGMAVVSMWEDGGLTPLGFLLCDIWQIPLFKKKIEKIHNVLGLSFCGQMAALWKG